IHRGNVGGNVIVEGRITRLRLARPLRVEFCLRPKTVFFARGESLHRVFASLRSRWAVDIGDVSRPAPCDLVDDVDRIAVAKKIRRPAIASVRSTDPAAPSLPAAMNHDDRIRMRLSLWDLELDKCLSNHRHVTIAFDVFAADVEIALSCNGEDVV